MSLNILFFFLTSPLSQKWDYWLTLVYPSQIQKVAAKMDKVLKSVLNDLVGIEIPEKENGHKRPSWRTIWKKFSELDHETIGLVDIFKSGWEWSHMRDFIYIKCCAKGFFSEMSILDNKWILKIAKKMRKCVF